MTKQLNGVVLDGAPSEIAEQIFKQVIGPIFDNMAKENQQAAAEFGYCIAGNAIACYLGALDDVDFSEKIIIDSTKEMAADVKRSRKKFC